MANQVQRVEQKRRVVFADVELYSAEYTCRDLFTLFVKI